MLMINPGATFIAVAVAGLIYAIEKRRHLKAQWGDMRYGLLMLLAGFAIRHLDRRKPDERTWRPNLPVLSGALSRAGTSSKWPMPSPATPAT